MASTSQQSNQTRQTFPRLPLTSSHKKLPSLRPLSSEPSTKKPSIPSALQHQSVNETSILKSVGRARSQSALSSARQALASANSSKAVRLEATVVVYGKKTQELMKLEYLVDKELREVGKNIEILRVNNKNNKTDHISNRVNTTTTSSKISTNTKTQIMVKGNTQDSMRRRIDLSRERGKKVRNEVDQIRKEISTLHKLNQQLQVQLQNSNQMNITEENLMAQLEHDLQMCKKQLQEKKIETVRKRQQVLKDYESILQKLTKQLNSITDKEQQQGNHQFYLTDPNQANKRPTYKQKQSQASATGKTNQRITALETQLASWRQISTKVQEKLQVSSLSQLQQQVVASQEENYKNYNYLNQRHQYLQELIDRKKQLNQRYEETQKEQEGKKERNRQQEEGWKKVEKVRQGQTTVKEELNQIEALQKRLREFLSQLAIKTTIKTTNTDINEGLEQIIKYLGTASMS